MKFVGFCLLALTEVLKPCTLWNLELGPGSRRWKFEIWGLVFGVWAWGLAFRARSPGFAIRI